jgi:mevalonate pyrophosphate decarboxylase
MNAYSPQELNDAMALARQNVEQFRFEAAKAHGAYTKQQRKWDRQLGSGSAAAGEFYAAYREKLRPSLVQIEKKQA